MGKKQRLHRFISRWMKSDRDLLPEDGSTVLLLGVTRIATSPPPVRRPCSLNLNLRPHSGHVPMRSSSIPQPAAAPTNHVVHLAGGAAPMDRSVDSIGACSLDVDASAALLSDHRESASVATLRSESIKSLEQHHAEDQHRLPSYLALACTVNGYSQITNYDPVRLARSRDPSPHRPLVSHEPVNYAIHNNLLSPPNLVPLPATCPPRPIMEQSSTFYAMTKSTFVHKYIGDTVDACIGKCSVVNGTSKEPEKSFIQQRVERLYGPGALAQGFFVMKRRKSRGSESDALKSEPTIEDKQQHSKSMSDKLLLDTNNMKQSASSPALPVLRHLTPEFRAQLPKFSPRKGVETMLMQKSTTLPELNESVTIKEAMNGHGPDGNAKKSESPSQGCRGGSDSDGDCVDVKDGHYFLKILENEASRLLRMAEQAERDLESNEKLAEDAKGFLRAAAGKARLLVSQKMQQFRGLCTNNLNQSEGEAFPTTNEDLQGFWDMVMLQVDQVDSIFKDLETMRANNWQEVIRKPSESNHTIKNRSKMTLGGQTTRARCAGAEEARAKREAQRKQMLEARRKAMREAKKAREDAVEIFVPES